MTKNKKILLSLGTLVAITAPVATVVACGTKKSVWGLVKPESKGTYELKFDLTLDVNNPEALKNKFLEEAQKYKERFSKIMPNQIELSYVFDKNSAKSIMQKIVDGIYKFGILKEILNIKYKDKTFNQNFSYDFTELFDFNKLDNTDSRARLKSLMDTMQNFTIKTLNKEKSLWRSFLGSDLIAEYRKDLLGLNPSVNPVNVDLTSNQNPRLPRLTLASTPNDIDEYYQEYINILIETFRRQLNRF